MKNSTNQPNCLAIIPDGNRRFAKQHSLDPWEGHKIGAAKFEELIDVCIQQNIKHLVLYLFSTENWKRSKKEVSYLMELFQQFAEQKSGKMIEQKQIQIRFFGQLHKLPKKLQNLIDQIHKTKTPKPKLTVHLAISYGGKVDLLHASKALQQSGKKVTPASFHKALLSASVPDVDVLVRYGKQNRISNFLPYQIAYSEIYFVDKFWPEFNKNDIVKIVKMFKNTQRRFGK